MTLTPLSVSHTMSGRPIPSRPRDLVIIPAAVKSVQCFCRIMVLKASCSKEQQNIDANRKKKKPPSFPNKNFCQFLLLLKPLCFWHVYFMVQSSNPGVAMNKDYVEYEEQITKMAAEVLQIPKEYMPGWENILADSSLGRERIV